MISYLARCVARAVTSLAVVSVVVFVVSFVLPSGDLARLRAGRDPSAQMLERIREELALDRPIWVQFGRFERNLFLGDRYGWPGLGYEYSGRFPVRDELLRRVPVTIQLAVGAVLLALLLGIPIGLLSTARPRPRAGRAAMLTAMVGASLPPFTVATLLLYLVWFKLRITCTGPGYRPIALGLARWSCGLALPWVTLGLPVVVLYARAFRRHLLLALDQAAAQSSDARDDEEAPRMVGRSVSTAFRSMIAAGDLNLVLVVSWAIVVELIFHLPGVGSFAWLATAGSDFQGVMGAMLIGASLVVLGNFVLDVARGVTDPRVRSPETSASDGAIE